ncbi:unnamed protein product [Spirodela intermedia]|uniref:COBRA C-terminal domain-containing protein n=1 Tax=Spirodela intermedia TaxID=51605 RepID=A0A7I8IKK1_SPIIN|nr:unnamed protein product [Spirodela intermedia]CAA6658273.1 unnamed protein product [Spirodela intermedia]
MRSRTHFCSLLFLLLAASPSPGRADDYGLDEEAATPPAAENCDGIFLTYTFLRRSKEYPHVKNASAQAWAFESVATLLNTGRQDLQGWNLFIGFQHGEILVSASGAVLTEGPEFPAHTDLKNSIDTAGDINQIQIEVQLKGTQFGLRDPALPMPRTLKLLNDGYLCPKPTRHGSVMYLCCSRDPKFKANKMAATKFLPRRAGDLTIAYDVLQAFEGKYLAQVTLDNWNPLGRLDNWNLTWEWKRGEFIYSMKGAYTHLKDASSCIYGEASTFYQSLDFAAVLNCQRRPVIADLPQNAPKPSSSSSSSRSPGHEPHSSLPPTELEDRRRPQPRLPLRAAAKGQPHGVPGPFGLDAVSTAVASWQVVCNITRPKAKASRCCVSFSAYYNDSVVPCGTCACGCADGLVCDADAPPLLLPSEALLVPFNNRTAKAKAWASIKHRPVPNPLPCGDFCGVSINWHIYSNYRNGWTARITIFNWEGYTFKDWFAAVQLRRAFQGYERVYSFNGTKLPELHNTLFFEGLPGLNYLMPLSEDKDQSGGSRVPGKQQSVISFTKKLTPGIDIEAGDGFPSRVYFNGEECALPTDIPRADAGRAIAASLSWFRSR